MVKNIVVSTLSGKLQGLFLKSTEGDDYYSFKGVPYAKPPIGDLRFQDPKPFDSWKDIRDATQHGPVSLQYDMGAKDVVGSEDCLYLNVYTRSIEKNSRLPVLFWVHGGAFLMGSGNSEEFGPDYFIRKDVVLVTINYRLGIFGFLNLDCKLATGNQGLKDQVMALQWVKSHIEYFGGDSENVTIFGGSAGGACVNLLATSPLANGLFHKAICQSGCALNPWAIKREPKKSLDKFLNTIGKHENDPEKIFEFLKTENSRKLMETQHKITTYREWLQLDFPFCPTIDVKSSAPFMPVDITTSENGTIHVPFMAGYNNLEGIIMIPFLQHITVEELDQNMKNYLSYDLQNFLSNHKLSLKDLRKLYLEDEEITESNLFQFLHLACDISFNEGLHRLAKIQADNSSAPTYFYKLSFDRNNTPFKMVNKISMKGVGHGDELLYQFKMQVHDTLNIKQLKNDIAETVMKRMIELWVNFAKTGRPTPKVSELIPTYWQPINSGTVLRYLDISDDMHMKKMLNFDEQYSIK